MEQHIIQYLPEIAPRTLVIPNPIDTALVRKLAQMPLEYNLPNCPIFITIARLDAIKGHLRILEALTLLDFPFCYFIVGEGQEREVIDAHVYLQGSYSEAFPNVILEALCLGITPIAFDISGGTSEIIRSGENGFLAMETNDFASSINHVLEKPFLSHKLTETIHLFDLKNVMDIYSKLL